MGKKKQKNKRKSELKVIFFIILVSAALFILSTYAWFSTQKDVSITNLSGMVEVAEGLEISLDALNWSNEIVLGEDMNIIDNAYAGHRNVSPTELLPVSTLGLVSGSTMTDIKMIRGKLTNSKVLSEIQFMDETETNSEDPTYPGYFAFDIFLKNSSKQEDFDDILQLNYNSSLQIIEDGNDKVGLQNTARIAFAKYGTGEIVSTDPTTGENIREGVANVMDSQQDILKETGTSVEGANRVYISDVAIWEPNSNDHIEYIVNNNNNITWKSGSQYEKDFTKHTLPNGKKGFQTTDQMPTYALKEGSAVKGNEIKDIYLWDDSETCKANLQEQMTCQTTKTSETDYQIAEGVQNLISTSSTARKGTDRTPFSIAPNSVIRMRVYLWLEGQDVDCINYASHGGGITVNIGLVKGSDENTKAPVVE